MRSRSLIFIIAALAITNIATASWAFYLFLRAPVVENPYPLIDFSRNFIPQEHFITNIEPLRQELRDLITEEGASSISLYFEYLNTGANISINQDLNIWPASLAKLPLAMVIMKKIEDGIWELDNELVLLEHDKDPLSGNLHKNQIGTRFTIETLLKELLSSSDNTAYHILLRNTTSDELNGIITALGLDELFTPDGRVSAKEYSRLFRALYTSSFLGREHSQLLLTWLSEASFKDYLARPIPPEIPFAHKYGENTQYFVASDSGIVYAPNRPYLITVMMQAAGKEESDKKRIDDIMHTISEKTYRYVTNY